MRVISKFNKGQSTLEYAILIIIIIGALLTIQAYIKRGLQGRTKSSADDIGEQYDPGNVNYHKIKNSSSSVNQTAILGVARTELLADEVTNEWVSQNIANLRQAYWGPK
jgi:uncharacterized protein (UPF0333 family)